MPAKVLIGLHPVVYMFNFQHLVLPRRALPHNGSHEVMKMFGSHQSFTRFI